jgi:hypothetical protein
MVKELVLKDEFPYSLERIIKDTIFNSNFEENHHKLLGNTGVTVTDWIESRVHHSQRVCFFTLLDKDNDMDIYIVENQEASTEKELTLELKSTLVPDSKKYGNVFEIKSDWSIVQIDNNQCELNILITVSCKHVVWGVTDMAESILAQKVEKLYLKWCSHAKDELKKLSQVEVGAKKEVKEIKKDEFIVTRNELSPRAQINQKPIQRQNSSLLEPIGLVNSDMLYRTKKQKAKYSDSEDVIIQVGDESFSQQQSKVKKRSGSKLNSITGYIFVCSEFVFVICLILIYVYLQTL